MNIPLSPDFTPVENVLPEIKHMERDELVISIEWLKKNCTKICGDMSWYNSCLSSENSL